MREFSIVLRRMERCFSAKHPKLIQMGRISKEITGTQTQSTAIKTSLYGLKGKPNYQKNRRLEATNMGIFFAGDIEFIGWLLRSGCFMGIRKEDNQKIPEGPDPRSQVEFH